MANKVNIDAIDIQDIYSFMETGSVDDAPEEIVRYLTLLARVHGMHLRIRHYGTKQHILKDLVGTWEYSTVKGRLYQEGWGAQMGYPGVILDNEGQTIQGSIFSSPELSKKWEFLDDFEA